MEIFLSPAASSNKAHLASSAKVIHDLNFSKLMIRIRIQKTVSLIFMHHDKRLTTEYIEHTHKLPRSRLKKLTRAVSFHQIHVFVFT